MVSPSFTKRVAPFSPDFRLTLSGSIAKSMGTEEGTANVSLPKLTVFRMAFSTSGLTVYSLNHTS